jgi:hypothetical protein
MQTPQVAERGAVIDGDRPEGLGLVVPQVVGVARQIAVQFGNIDHRNPIGKKL